MGFIETESRLWEDVEVGTVLPILEFPITVRTMVVAAAGTRDFAPYHHDSAYAKSVGNPEMFVNTMFMQALFSRFATDSSGPESDIRETSLKMTGVLCCGDVAKVEGRVADKSERDGDHCVTLELSISNEAGPTAINSIILAMPSREHGPVVPRTSLEKPSVEPNPETPNFAKEWIGKESEPYWGAYTISEAQLMYWCDMVEDANPLYVDCDYARKSRHGGVIAPPVALITWTMPRANQMPDVNAPDRKLWPPLESEPENSLPAPPGMTEVIVQSSQQVYGNPLRPGDRVYTKSETIAFSPLKETRVGPGYFQTRLETYYNQRDEIVGTEIISFLWYGASN